MRVKRDSAALKFSSSSDIDEASPFKNNEEEAERDAMLGSRTSVEGDVKGVGDDMGVWRLHQVEIV